MKNALVARIFYDMADILDIKGENPFRIRAYRRAAQNIESHAKDVADMGTEELVKIPGIGEDLAGKVREIVETGTCKDYEKLRKGSPAGLTELLAVQGLGPRTAKLIYDRFKVSTVDDLEKLAREHKLAKLPKIKEKTEQNILRGIEMLKRGTARKPLGKVLPVANEIYEFLRKKAPVGDLAIAGSIRRWKETIQDIDILATSGSPEKVMEVFAGMAKTKDVLAKGVTKTTIMYDGIQADLRVVEKGSFGAALCYFTGSKQHNIRLREMGVKKGLKINEYGIFDRKEKKVGGAKEEDVYKILGMPFIPPELREDAGEIEAALAGRLPVLIEPSDIRGDLHVHSKWSDGSHSVWQMAEAARKRGYGYIAISDHSKSIGIARGLDEDRVLEQIKEIDALNKKMKGFRVLKGIEVDIRSDLTLDLPDKILARLDLVNASIHSGFRQSGGQLTKRILAAMKNPYVTIICHPTGRLLGEREAYELDMDAVLKAAKDTGTALEINAYPMRLDLNDANARRARDMGVKLAISTDAHLVNQFDYMTYGVSIARRAWAGKGDVLNTLGAEELMKAIKAKRQRK
jgi:DNA polymerase (family 10)